MKSLIEKYKRLPVQIKATIAFFICSLLQKGISVITTPIFTRILSEEEYGQFGAFNSWYEIVGAIVSLSLVGGVYTTALVKFEKDRKILASSAQGLVILSCATFIIIYTAFSGFWNKLFSLSSIQIFAMLMLVLTTTSFGLWSIEQRVTYNYRRLVLVTIVVSLAKPIVCICLVLNSNDKVTARIIGLVIVEIACYFWIVIYQLVRGKKFFSKKYWLYIIRFSLPLIPHTLSSTVLNSSDRIMIQSIVGDKETGYYTLAYSVALLMIILNTSLAQALAPWTYQKLKDRKERDINNIATVTCIIIATMNIVLILMAPEVISIFAPNSYLGAIYVIPPVAMSAYLMHLYDWFARVEYFYEKTHYILIASISGAAINVILNYIFIPIFGYVAAGYTTVVSYGVYTAMHYLFMKRICKKEMGIKNIYNSKQLFSITLIFIAISLVLNYSYQIRMIRYSILAGLIIISIIYRKSIYNIIRRIINIRKESNNE